MGDIMEQWLTKGKDGVYRVDGQHPAQIKERDEKRRKWEKDQEEYYVTRQWMVDQSHKEIHFGKR